MQLDLDKFEKNLRNCLIFENVIGMMFYGNSHTTDPLRWITEFRGVQGSVSYLVC